MTKEIEELAQILCATFASERPIRSDSRDYDWESVGLEARRGWIAVAKKAIDYLQVQQAA